jgi:Domain of unknown function (DUF1830)
MTQILDAVPVGYTALLCSYRNTTNQIQILRIANVAHWYFERVVFPGEHLLFEAPSEADLEINTGHEITAILSDRIPCSHLRVMTGEGMSLPSLGKQKGQI